MRVVGKEGALGAGVGGNCSSGMDGSKTKNTTLDIVQNSPPEIKIPTPIILVEKNTFFFQKSRTPPIH